MCHPVRLGAILIYFLAALSAFTDGGPRSVYVDAKGNSSGNGSKQKPFTSLEQAITHLITKESPEKNQPFSTTVIYVQSSMEVKDLLLLTIPVKIIGMNNAVLSFIENTGFFVYNTQLAIEDCRIIRKERKTEPRTVPLIYGSQSTIHLNNVVIESNEGGEMVILRNSNLFCKTTVFDTVQNAQALLLRAEKSTIETANTTFICKGVFACIFSFREVECTLQDTYCTVLAENSGIVAELVQSRMKCQELHCVYTPSKQRTKALSQKALAAVKADAVSEVTFIPNCDFKGFSNTVYKDTAHE
ncbi:MAG: hypothetical protein ACTTJ7_04485 [Treponema sp.]